MMELKIIKIKRILLVLAMIFIQTSTTQVEITSPSKEIIRKVEQIFLSAAGLKERPNIDRTKIRIPPEMFKLHEKIDTEYESTALPLPGRLTRSSNIVRSYTHEESVIDERFPHNDKFRLNFNVSSFPENEVLVSSELRLTIVPKEYRNDVKYTLQRVNVYDIIKPGIKGKTKPMIRIVDTKVVNTSTETNISLDVLPIIERWLSNYEDNYGLLVEVKSLEGDKVSSHVRLRRTIEAEEHWYAVQPVLFLYAESENVKKVTMSGWTQFHRVKRSTQPKGKRRSRDECRRHELYVNFKILGWDDWIVAPAGYHAFYCGGDCPSQYSDHLNTTNHAIVQSLVHTVYPQTIPKPCCVPTTLAPISMLYLDENNKAVLKNYNDMVVEGCGCR